MKGKREADDGPLLFGVEVFGFGFGFGVLLRLLLVDTEEDGREVL
jgi:hypothetical protein